jgi:hypothetical protein
VWRCDFGERALGRLNKALLLTITRLREVFRMRMDVVAAVASAVGAVASAIVAIYALSYLAPQEEIARGQLRATYLSILYNKQVDGFAALEVSVLNFLVKAQKLRAPSVAVANNISRLSSNEWAQLIKEALSGRDEFATDVKLKTTSVALVFPDALRDAITVPSRAVNEIMWEADTFSRSAGTDQDFSRYASSTDTNFSELDQWIKKMPDCVQSIFGRGAPITNQDKCDYTSIYILRAP